MKTFHKLLSIFNALFLALFTSVISSGQSNVTVSTGNVTMINATWASCFVGVNGSPVSEKGACCWTKPAPTISQKKFIANSKNVVQLTGLTPATKYWVRGYAKSGNIIVYGNEMSFTTTDPPKNNSNTGKKQESKQEPIK
jgi:hypothetical protein